MQAGECVRSKESSLFALRTEKRYLGITENGESGKRSNVAGTFTEDLWLLPGEIDHR
jgi:hypothetical protein